MNEQRIFFKKGKVISLIIPEIEKDLECCTHWINNEHLRNYLSSNTVMTRISEKEWFEKNLSKISDENLSLGIWHNADNKLIGMIGIHNYSPRDRNATTGTLIGADGYRGKGFGTHAKMLFLEYVFNSINLEKIYSDVIGFNKRSIRYSKKCGYKEVARIPDYFYREGSWHDKVTLVVEKKEWQKIWDEKKSEYLP